ncbi:hypothetical protein cypCar_00028108 [Cyprinus carpio]|nr:hypothetical protein cypCar_00028108 [Cyprinus carpio]
MLTARFHGGLDRRGGLPMPSSMAPLAQSCCGCGVGAWVDAGSLPQRRAGWGVRPADGWRQQLPPGQDVLDRLSLLLCSIEMLGHVFDCVAEEAGLGHMDLEELNLSASLMSTRRSWTTSVDVKFARRKIFQALSTPAETTDMPNIPFSSLFSFDGVRESVQQLRDKLEDFCKEELKKISDKVTFTNIVPWTRNDFLQYSHQLTLDLNTVNNFLHLSKRNRVITFSKTFQPYPDHPERFDKVYPQVLCRESVCGRRYWEIEWSGDDGVHVSVSYKSISRKGEEFRGKGRFSASQDGALVFAEFVLFGEI